MTNVIWNMLQEYSNRSNIPSGLDIGKRKIQKICDQRDIGPVTLDIEHRLSAEISDYSFTAEYKEGEKVSKLSNVIEDSSCSFPAVELGMAMFDPDGYDTQPDENHHARKLTVLVLAVNHKTVLYYDPLRYGNTNTNQIHGIETSEIDKQEFVNAWKGRSETTTTLWIEETEQSRIPEYS
ncbi:hypothetical protein [Halorubrum sp. N11]|uniref:hypothetical protein n=1 Tax=Halorubrum sp. N11 TaxID=3402276 RepID=UPI003EB8A984